MLQELPPETATAGSALNLDSFICPDSVGIVKVDADNNEPMPVNVFDVSATNEDSNELAPIATFDVAANGSIGILEPTAAFPRVIGIFSSDCGGLCDASNLAMYLPRSNLYEPRSSKFHEGPHIYGHIADRALMRPYFLSNPPIKLCISGTLAACARQTSYMYRSSPVSIACIIRCAAGIGYALR